MRKTIAFTALVAALGCAFALGACSQGLQAPTDAGVCYAMGAAKAGKTKFNVVASRVPDMEHCAAALEGMRVQFLQLGGSNTDIIGAYQGNFLFLSEEGVFTAANYDGVRYPFLIHTADGRLAPAGSAQ